MGPLSDENKLQVDEKTTTEKLENFFKNINIKNYYTICYKLTAWQKIIQLVLILKLMRPLSVLRLQKNRKNRVKSKKVKKIQREKCRSQ